MKTTLRFLHLLTHDGSVATVPTVSDANNAQIRDSEKSHLCLLRQLALLQRPGFSRCFAEELRHTYVCVAALSITRAFVLYCSPIPTKRSTTLHLGLSITTLGVGCHLAPEG